MSLVFIFDLHAARNRGCNGGWMNVAFQYLQTKGSQSQSSYPYVGKVINYIAIHACTLFTYGADCFI